MLHENVLIKARVREVTENLSVARTVSKKARGSGSQERVQPTQRRCGNCGKTGHNARTCQKDEEEASESNASESYASSIGSKK
ncbi:hypothetical protein BDW02DRAFT_574951 [Decorospora gaudefroyi]|uniref:CCHC-type domain-containing protein n=1 Tax=Decorospora gaudefroyi TaxID=184978 RepID=A0A6A5JWU7_9PLEO|nr:hypothetical protein BDW02DRAFT_574951 [Decorospora gaudefroyi]